MIKTFIFIMEKVVKNSWGITVCTLVASLLGILEVKLATRSVYKHSGVSVCTGLTHEQSVNRVCRGRHQSQKLIYNEESIKATVAGGVHFETIF